MTTCKCSKSFSRLLGSIEKAKHVPKEITEKTRHTVTKWVFQWQSWEPGMTSTFSLIVQRQGPPIRVLMGFGDDGRSSLVFESSMKLMVLYIFKWLEMITLNFTPPSERWNPWKNPLDMSGILAEHDDVAQFLIISLGGVPRLANKWNCTKLYWLFSSSFTKTFAKAHVTLSGQTIMIQLLPLGRMGGFPSLQPEVLVLVGKSTTIPDMGSATHCNLKSDVNFAAKTLSQQNGRTVAASLK